MAEVSLGQQQGNLHLLLCQQGAGSSYHIPVCLPGPDLLHKRRKDGKVIACGLC